MRPEDEELSRRRQQMAAINGAACGKAMDFSGLTFNLAMINGYDGYMQGAGQVATEGNYATGLQTGALPFDYSSALANTLDALLTGDLGLYKSASQAMPIGYGGSDGKYSSWAGIDGKFGDSYDSLYGDGANPLGYSEGSSTSGYSACGKCAGYSNSSESGYSSGDVGYFGSSSSGAGSSGGCSGSGGSGGS